VAAVVSQSLAGIAWQRSAACGGCQVKVGLWSMHACGCVV
jgi:hypothetical protein